MMSEKRKEGNAEGFQQGREREGVKGEGGENGFLECSGSRGKG